MRKTHAFLISVLALPETDECILWPFSLSDGYGQVSPPMQGSDGKKYHGAHRAMCAMAHGSPPARKYEAAHSCNVRNCVNPKHLSWKTGVENQFDQWGHGTKRYGTNHHNSKLTDEAVLEFLAIARQYAERYGCSIATLGRVLQKDGWKHLKI